MNNLHEYKAHLNEIAKRSKDVLSWVSFAQLNSDGIFIAIAPTRAKSILEEAVKAPIFEGISENVVGQLSSSWASALAYFSAK